MKTYAILSDIQIPFQDKPVLDLVLAFVKQLKPHGVILNGDIADCYSISSHRRDATTLTKNSLNHEIEQCHRLMAALEGAKEKWWLGGNHEDRFYRHVNDNAPALGLIPGLDFQTIFGLGEHGFRWKGYGDYVMLGKLLVTHGDIVRKHAGYSAKAHFDKYGISVLHGHTHRIGNYCHTNIHGMHGAWENGCLCKLDGLGYAHHPDWQQGFSVVQVGERGFFNVIPIRVLDRRVFFYGAEKWER